MVFILYCLPIQKLIQQQPAASSSLPSTDHPRYGGGDFFGSQTVDRLFHPSVQGPRQWDGPGFEFSSIHGKSNNDDDEMR
jgi:hypothetical protein